MDMDLSETAPTSEPLFRPTKRRKFYRKREEDNEDGGNTSVTTLRTTEPSIATPPSQADTEGSTQSTAGDLTHLSMTDILRLRKAVRSRKGGIEFSARSNNVARGNSPSAGPTSDALIEREQTPEEIQPVVNRFAPQTGQIADVDKHMMAYIDAELAKRREGPPSADSPAISSEQAAEAAAARGSDVHLHRQPAALGKLHEIDLGPDAKLRNIALTEEARKRLEGGDDVADTPTTDRARKPPKLGRDGKPWRGRKRRTSEDIKRDKLVEEVLKETRLDLYDPPANPLDNPDPNNPDASLDPDQAADDRIAEQFRREFLDAIQSRRKRASRASKPASSSSLGALKKDDKPRGPKLGGSRSARAAMREREMAEKGGKR
ncbi:MAG: hypothetical protein M1819_002678 [Sarea resinae]|nr:MAG: hypothetical protein M1819_002678 [Sarea resinae]